MNHCSVRFICSNYSDRIECDYYKENVDCLREIHCEHEFNGECINKDAQKQALQERIEYINKRRTAMKRQKALTQCSYCGALKLKRFFWYKWINYKIPVIRSGNVSHGICPECFAREMKKVEEEG